LDKEQAFDYQKEYHGFEKKYFEDITELVKGKVERNA